ncbi:MAG: MFS transporter [Anaerolineaceae bacterium]|nr:MFS transporter [Anaerolineaceae bacterium]
MSHSIPLSSNNEKDKINTSFYLIWFGQLISLVGSAMTSFALSLWVYQQSGSVTQFALINVFAILPRILLSPIAGPLIDKRNRKWVLILSDSLAACTTVFLAIMFFTGQIVLWHILLAAFINAAAGTFQWPAFMASMTMLVPEKQLGKANGMLQFNQAAAEIFSPMVGGLLIIQIGIAGVLIIDLATFLIAVITLLISRIPQPQITVSHDSPTMRSRWQDAMSGLNYIRSHKGLSNLVWFSALVNFLWGMVAALLAPMILEFANADQLGLILSIAGTGLLTGSLLMSAWGGTTPKMKGVFLFEAVSALGFFFFAFRPNVWIIAGAAFIAHFTIAVAQGSVMSIWQVKVPKEIQGRVFSAQQMVTRSMMPLALILSGPLADKLIRPLLSSNPGLASFTVGSWATAGDGARIAFIFLAMCFVKFALIAFSALNPAVRNVEQ